MYMTGFGTESDSPGESLWYIENYFRYTRDEEWLSRQWEYIKRKFKLIFGMMDADKTLRSIRETVIPLTHFEPDGDLICEKSDDGLIIGRMDWHRPLIWVNAWSAAGLRSAKFIAEALKKDKDAEDISRYLNKLEKRLHEYAGAFLGDNERDFAAIVWPTRMFRPDAGNVKKCYEKRWEGIINGEGKYELKTEWTYFDMADAHNRLFMGQKDRMWDILSWYLNNQNAKGMYLWKEGPQWHADRSTTWSRVAGWIDHPTIVPHGWIASETALLIRDLFAFEEDETLVLGAGIKDEWLREQEDIAIENFYSYWGRLGYRVSYSEGKIAFDIDLPENAPAFEIRLTGYKVLKEFSEGISILKQKSWIGCNLLSAGKSNVRVVLGAI
jgi:hypothetical protein